MSHTSDSSVFTFGTIVRKVRAELAKLQFPLESEELLPSVFGKISGAPADLWMTMLNNALEQSDVVIKTPDGRWGLPEWDLTGADLTEIEFAVVDIETTGLAAQRDSILEIGVMIVRGGEQVDTFQTYVRPERKIPEFITQFTGITHDMTQHAPSIAEALPAAQKFIGIRPVVGHNVSFDLGFLTYAAEMNHWYFPAEGLDTIAMARRFAPECRRYKLEILARFLGVTVHQQHRAMGDVATTAGVFFTLLELARAKGIRTLDDLTAALNMNISFGRLQPGSARPTGKMYLNPAWRQHFPESPGVYIMRNEIGEIIYIGKAKNLKNRLQSYYSHPLGYTRKMDGLLQNVKSIETVVLGSELEALLTESRLIKEHQPRYNVQLRNYEEYPFIKIDISADFPRVYATKQISADGGRYFGPFNSRRAVDATIDVIQKLFAIRTCTRSLPPRAKPSDACLRYHMGRCPAPCRGDISPAEYQRVIHEVIEFLANSRNDMMDALRQKMWDAADKDDFEKAAALRDIIQNVDRVLLGQKLITGAVEANNLCIVYPSVKENHVELFLVRHGRLIEQRAVLADAPVLRQTLNELLMRAEWLAPRPTKIGKAEVDQIAIISRWIHQHSDEFGRRFFTLPDDLTDESALEAFRAAMIAETCALHQNDVL